MDIPKEVVRNCVGLGLLSCRLPSMREGTLKIFEAVKICSPDSPAWLIGTAMVHANADANAEQACTFLMKEGVSATSGDLMARAYLGLFLTLAKRTREAERVVQSVIADAGEPGATELAQAVLDHEINKR